MKETKIFIKNFEEYGTQQKANKYCEFVAIREDEEGIDEEIRIRLNEDGTLKINTNHKLKILSMASNSVFIDFSK